MGWTLALLFIISGALLIISISKSIQASRVEQKKIDLAHISVMKEINDLQDSVRNVELDIEVVMNEAGIQLSTNELHFRREVLDLYRRNYSIESIASKMQVQESEISQLIAPYQSPKNERRKVANEN